MPRGKSSKIKPGSTLKAKGVARGRGIGRGRGFGRGTATQAPGGRGVTHMPQLRRGGRRSGSHPGGFAIPAGEVPFHTDGLIRVELSGVDTHLLAELSTFLAEQVGPFEAQHQIKGRYKLQLAIGDPDLAARLVGLSGIIWNNHKVTIRQLGGGKGGGGGSPGMPLTQQNAILAQILPTCVDPAAGLINLANFGAHPGLVGCRIDFNKPPFVGHILKSLKEICPEATTLVLDGNGIRSLKGFSSLGRELGKVVNVSLADNLISAFGELESLGQADLRELLLRGNPITQETPEVFVAEVQKRFHRLAILDGQPITPLFSFGTEEITKKGEMVPPTGSFFDLPETRQMVEAFLPRFLQLFDERSDDLLNVYAEGAFFSLNHVSSGPRTGSTPDKRSTVDHYFPHSRNLQYMKDRNKKMALLCRGSRIDLVHAIRQLPPTQHVFESIVLDALSGGGAQVMIACGGTFLEVVGQVLVEREFYRTLVVAHAPTSPGAPAGFPFVVLNDQLTVRAKKGPPQAGKKQSGAVNRDALVAQFSAETGLTPDFAFMCLQANHWVYGQAMQEFSMKSQTGGIPPEGFM